MRQVEGKKTGRLGVVIVVVVILAIIGCLLPDDEHSSSSSSSSSSHACAICGRTSGVSYRSFYDKSGYKYGPNYFCYNCVKKYGR